MAWPAEVRTFSMKSSTLASVTDSTYLTYHVDKKQAFQSLLEIKNKQKT